MQGRDGLPFLGVENVPTQEWTDCIEVDHPEIVFDGVRDNCTNFHAYIIKRKVEAIFVT